MDEELASVDAAKRLWQFSWTGISRKPAALHSPKRLAMTGMKNRPCYQMSSGANERQLRPSGSCFAAEEADRVEGADQTPRRQTGYNHRRSCLDSPGPGGRRLKALPQQPKSEQAVLNAGHATDQRAGLPLAASLSAGGWVSRYWWGFFARGVA